jgi:hypothetical protein
MIVSRDNLLIFDIGIATDKKLPALGHLHITGDGDTVACNAKTIMIVEAVPEDRAAEVPFKGKGLDQTDPVSLPIDYIGSLVKATPKDKQFGGLLELIHISGGKTAGLVQATLHDGKGEKTSKRQSYKNPFIDFRGILNKLYYSKEIKASFVLDRPRLIKTLQSFEKICGAAPCHIEVTEGNDLMIRSVIPTTGQKVMALVTGVMGDKLEKGPFEQKFSDQRRVRAVKKKKRITHKKRSS